jgi:hypothetical protein
LKTATSRAAASYITTSWDDGHPFDLRLAELLVRYSIPGTFYIPFSCQRPVLAGRDLRELGERFDIGAHTMGHVDLCHSTAERAQREITDSKRYIEDSTGKACTVFAPPHGRFRPIHIGMTEQAGFRGMRTVELMNTGSPARHRSLAVLPTSLQVYPHQAPAYLKNAVKRCRPGNLLTYCAHGLGRSLHGAADSLFASVARDGGVFHLWGHSWELEEYGLWETLESILRGLRENIGLATPVTNAELCEVASAP